MVEDRLTDGRRIAELLSSELTGLAVGPLSAVTVVDADPAVEPSDVGTLAYRISHEGTVVAAVFVSPSAARLAFEGPDVDSPDLDEILERVGHQGLSLVGPGDDGDTGDDGPVAVRVENGAAVKGAVDVLQDVLEVEGLAG